MKFNDKFMMGVKFIGLPVFNYNEARHSSFSQTHRIGNYGIRGFTT